MTSLRLMFIQLSQLTRWPLYVSPFFSSTSWGEKEHDQQPAALEFFGHNAGWVTEVFSWYNDKTQDEQITGYTDGKLQYQQKQTMEMEIQKVPVILR